MDIVPEYFEDSTFDISGYAEEYFENYVLDNVSDNSAEILDNIHRKSLAEIYELIGHRKVAEAGLLTAFSLTTGYIAWKKRKRDRKESPEDEISAEEVAEELEP